MRQVKRWGKVNLNKNTGRLEPFRVIVLDSEELKEVVPLADPSGKIMTTEESEQILHRILKKRGMESLLYPKRELDDWSGYCHLEGLNRLVLL